MIFIIPVVSDFAMPCKGYLLVAHKIKIVLCPIGATQYGVP
jgi:hypothetical protein